MSIDTGVAGNVERERELASENSWLPYQGQIDVFAPQPDVFARPDVVEKRAEMMTLRKSRETNKMVWSVTGCLNPGFSTILVHNEGAYQHWEDLYNCPFARRWKTILGIQCIKTNDCFPGPRSSRSSCISDALFCS